MRGPWEESTRMRTPFAHRVMAVLSTLVVLCGLLTVGVFTAASASAGTDDYPSQWRNAPMDSMLDSWGEYNRECTSFVAWRLHAHNGFEMPFHDNATGWGADASSRGYPVNMTPAVGAVAWWSSGHVAWVEAVNGPNVTIEEYNEYYNGTYSERIIAANSVSGYIHFHDLTGVLPQSIAFDPANNTLYMAAEEPGGTLGLYWNPVGSTIQGPLTATGGVGQDTSAPSIAFDPANNTLYMVAQEPGNTLGLYWDAVGSTIQGPLTATAGVGQDASAPSIAFDPANNTLYLTAQEPSNALGLYWDPVGSTIQGPLSSG